MPETVRQLFDLTGKGACIADSYAYYVSVMTKNGICRLLTALTTP